MFLHHKARSGYYTRWSFMKIDEYVPVWKWILQKGPQIVLVALTGWLLGALIRLLAGCFSPEDQRRDPGSQWGSLLSWFITDTDKSNLLHECWDMIINVLINECVTFKGINELCGGWFIGLWLFLALAWSSTLQLSPDGSSEGFLVFI